MYDKPTTRQLKGAVNIAGCLDPADKTEKLYAVDVVLVKKNRSLVALAAVKADKACANYSWSGYRVYP